MSGRRLLSALPAALVLAACSGQAGAPTSAPTQTRAPSVPATSAQEGRVGLSEWTFTTSPASLTESTRTLRVTNVGSTPHDLQVRAGERILARTATLAPGQQETITLDLSGFAAVTLLCTLPGHRSQGMMQDLPVAIGVHQEGSVR